MISVVLCKVSRPSRYKQKSYDENFVTAKCACINDGATLNEYFKAISPYFPVYSLLGLNGHSINALALFFAAFAEVHVRRYFGETSLSGD